MKTQHSTSAIHRIARVLVLGALLTGLLGSPQPAHAVGTIRYAAPGGMAVGACNSWLNACHLQYAISVAVSGDQVWVKQGTHLPIGLRRRQLHAEERREHLRRIPGTETLLSQRNPATHVTILSGDIGITGDASDNSYHVVVGSGTDATAALDGFTISAGNGNGEVLLDRGGGLYNDSGSPTLANLVISGNVASIAGGMYNWNSSPALTNVTFSGNTAASFGGGMYNASSSPLLADVTFLGNDSGLSGGGMLNELSTMSLTHVTLSGNHAGGEGGGMYNFNSGSILMEVTFSGNDADGNGGGLFNSGGSTSLTNVTLSGNEAAGSGGGIYNLNANAGLENVTLGGNQAGQQGGGMYNQGSSPALMHATFSGNSADLGGGAMYYDADSAGQIQNSLFWNNGSEIYVFEPTGAAVVLTDNIVSGLCPAWASCTNVVSADPLLGPLANNGGFTQTMALSPLSPAIDAGGQNSTCALTDQRGITRPQGLVCDIGAYEYDGVETTLTYRSTGANDGWVLESSETSGSGGSMDAAATQFNLGDDATKKQYRGVLSFDTSSLPDSRAHHRGHAQDQEDGAGGRQPVQQPGRHHRGHQERQLQQQSGTAEDGLQGAGDQELRGQVHQRPGEQLVFHGAGSQQLRVHQQDRHHAVPAALRHGRQQQPAGQLPEVRQRKCDHHQPAAADHHVLHAVGESRHGETKRAVPMERPLCLLPCGVQLRNKPECRAFLHKLGPEADSAGQVPLEIASPTC